MTTYLVQLRQAHGGGGYPLLFKYSNVFYVEAASAQAAAEQGSGMWEALRQGMREYVFCYSVYATDLVEGTTNYFELPIDNGSQRGEVSNGGDTNAYNPIICLRIDMQVPSSLPSRKFIRAGFLEQDLAPGGRTMTGSLQGLIDSAFGAMLLEFYGSIVDVDGTPVSSYSVKGITTRQLGREAFIGVPSPPPFG